MVSRHRFAEGDGDPIHSRPAEVWGRKEQCAVPVDSGCIFGVNRVIRCPDCRKRLPPDRQWGKCVKCRTRAKRGGPYSGPRREPKGDADLVAARKARVEALRAKLERGERLFEPGIVT